MKNGFATQNRISIGFPVKACKNLEEKQNKTKLLMYFTDALTLTVRNMLELHGDGADMNYYIQYDFGQVVRSYNGVTRNCFGKSIELDWLHEELMNRAYLSAYGGKRGIASLIKKVELFITYAQVRFAHQNRFILIGDSNERRDYTEIYQNAEKGNKLLFGALYKQLLQTM